VQSIAFDDRIRQVRLLVGALFAITLAAATGCTTQISDEVVPVAAPSEAVRSAQRASVVFVDTRSPEQFAQGRLPGAVNLRFTDLPQPQRRRNQATDPRLQRAARIIVYGQNPGDVAARALAKRLIALGYENVAWLEAGIEGWRSIGGRIVRSDP
jgi:rhodanese-related sulfurtransferase